MEREVVYSIKCYFLSLPCESAQLVYQVDGMAEDFTILV